MTPHPHQAQSIAHLSTLFKHRASCIDCSATGTGKTLVAVSVAQALHLPTLVIAPKISLTSWKRTAEAIGDSVSVVNYELLRTGHTDFGHWQNQAEVDSGRIRYLVCDVCMQTFDPARPHPCYAHHAGIHCCSTKTKPLRYGKWHFHPGVKCVIFDEVHRCSGIDSLNAEILIESKRSGCKTLSLSATPALSPLNMRALGYSLDLHGLHDYYSWAGRLGVRRLPPMPGLHWAVSEDRQTQIMQGLRAALFPDRGVRVTTEEIPGFPEVDIQSELYDLEGTTEKVNRLYEEMQSALARHASKAAADGQSPLKITEVLRARQKIELLKVPIVAELVPDLFAKGFSVGIFVNFQETLAELRKRFADWPEISGHVTGARRDAGIDRFQSNKARGILIQSDAGGQSVDLQDLDGNFPRFGLVMPTNSAINFEQLVGRFPRNGGKSKSHYRVLLAANTVEEKIHRNLQRKLRNLSSLLDSDFLP